MSSLRTRISWRSALFGAATGMLVVMAFALTDMPLSDGGPMLAAVFLGALAGAAIGGFGLGKVAGWIAVVVAVVAGLLILTPLLDGTIERWVRRDPMPAQPLDALVVLSAGVTNSGRLDRAGTERLLSAMLFVDANHPKRLVTTRILETVAGREITSDADQRDIIAARMDTSAWRIVGPVYTTRDEAVQTAAALPPSTMKVIGVVTSPLHSRRACMTFEAVGYRVVCLPADSRSFTPGSLRAGETRFRGVVTWMYEQAGMIKYRSRGWIRS